MRVTIQLTDEVARALRKQSPVTPAAQQVSRLAHELGIELVPLHHRTDDRDLRRYFTADLPASERADRIVEVLRRDPSVTAAYVKPPEAMP
jgi:hypothetical protein